jgi:hypothetical protein
MARKRKVEDVSEQPLLEGVEQEAAAPAARLTVPLAADGSIDLERMRAGTREKLLRAVQGIQPQIAEDQAEAVKALSAIVPAVYAALGGLERFIASKATGLSTAEVAQFFQYTDAKVELLREPTAKVLAKHAISLGKYQDEMTLALLYWAIKQDEIHALMEYKRRKDQRADQPAAVPVAAPVAPTAETDV